MITRNEVRSETNAQTYRKGNDIYLSGKVHGMTIMDVEDDFCEGVKEVCAVVDGSYGRQYQVRVRVSETESEILEDECDCPAHEKYWGLCKHGVGTLLTYLDWRKRERHKEEAEINRMRRDGSSGAELRDNLDALMGTLGVRKGSDAATGLAERYLMRPEPVKAVRTTPGFSEMMSHYAMRDKAEFLPKVQAGQVELEPYVEFITADQIQVEFKIGIKRPYVVKSVSKLVAAIRNMDQQSYGAQLSFLHCMEAFAPDSRALVSFLIGFCEEKNLCYRSHSGFYASYMDDRRIYLDKHQLIDFFKSLAGRDVHVTSYLSSEMLYHVSEGIPELKLTLYRKDGGIGMKLPYWQYVQGKTGKLFLRPGTILVSDEHALEEAEDFLSFVFAQGGECEIANGDLPAFCQELLPTLEKQLTVDKQDVELYEYMPPEVVFRIYLDAPSKDMITCELYACYGEQKYSVFSDINNIWQLAKGRDVKREAAANHLIQQYFTAYDNRKNQMVLTGPDEMYTFLTLGMDDMRRLGEVFVSDNLKFVRVIAPPKVTVGVSMAGNLLELDLRSSDFPMDELAAILSRYDRKRKYFRLKSGDFVDMDDDGIRVLSDLRETLDLKEQAMKDGVVAIPRFRAMYLDSRLTEQEGVQVTRSRDFRALVRNMKTVDDNDFDIPANLNARLRGYQKKGYRWIRTLCSNGFGGILADDMGLGKTLQMITFLLSEVNESGGEGLKRSLIICPASLVFNWQNEFEQFAPSLNVKTVTGTKAERMEILKQAGEQDILVTSYDLLRRDVEDYKKLEFFCEVIDEAQFIKNHSTQGARAVKQINASFRMALTGTPVENSLSELWSIFDYLMPGFLLSYTRFRDNYEVPIVKNQAEEPLERLQKLIRPFILRRLKRDVLKDLPEKLEKNMTAHMEKPQQELYEAHVQRLAMQLHKQSPEEFADSRFQVLSELTRLRQLCCDPSLVFEDYDKGSAKLELCLELIRNAMEGGHKILLFSQFTSMLEIIQRRLTDEGIRFYLLTGATSKEKRADLVRKFNEDDTPVFCISLKAGGTGLNLTGADIVIHYDPWWNVAVENQATDRAHRIGQKSVVNVYKLIAKGTIEEKIVELQNRKQELADQVLSGDGLKNPTFTRDELLELLA